MWNYFSNKQLSLDSYFSLKLNKNGETCEAIASILSSIETDCDVYRCCVCADRHFRRIVCVCKNVWHLSHLLTKGSYGRDFVTTRQLAISFKLYANFPLESIDFIPKVKNHWFEMKRIDMKIENWNWRKNCVSKVLV